MRILLFLAGSIALALAQPNRYILRLSTGSAAGDSSTDAMTILVTTRPISPVGAASIESAEIAIVLAPIPGLGSGNSGLFEFDIPGQLGMLESFKLKIDGTDNWVGQATLQEHQDCIALRCHGNYFTSRVLAPDPLNNPDPIPQFIVCNSAAQFVGCCNCDYEAHIYLGRATSCFSRARCMNRRSQALNTILAQRDTRLCPVFQFYNHDARTCQTVGSVVCDRDQCGNPGQAAGSYYTPPPSEGLSCRTKCLCGSTSVHPGRTIGCSCCPLGQISDSSGVCSINAGCNDNRPCPIVPTPYVRKGRCMKSGSDGARVYRKTVSHGRSTLMVCPLGTVYNQAACGCVNRDKNSLDTVAFVCEPRISFAFNKNMYPMNGKRRSVLIKGARGTRPRISTSTILSNSRKRARFQGKGFVRLTQFQYSGYGKYLTIKLRFYPAVYAAAPAGQIDTLITNENCKRGRQMAPSILIAYDRGTGGPGKISARIRNERGDDKSVSVDTYGAGFNELVMTYGRQVASSNKVMLTLENVPLTTNSLPNNVGSAEMEAGSISKTYEALRLGRGCGRNTFFVGHMESLAIYRCLE